MTNHPRGTLYTGVTADICRRAWKLDQLRATNPDWRALYETLI